MRSSTSSSEPRRLWARVGVSVALVLALLELYLRLSGASAMVKDSVDLWSRERTRLESASPSAVALLGDSRMETGLAPEVMRGLIRGAEPVQLAVSGTSCLATLRDLAESGSFSGVVIAGVTYPSLTGAVDGPGSQQPWVAHYHAGRCPGRLDAAFNLSAKLMLQRSLRSLSHRPERMGRGLFTLSPCPLPAGERRLDRSLPLHFKERSTAADLERYQRRAMADKEPPPADRQAPAPEIDLAPARCWVAAIQERGGVVVFVRFPSSGPLLRHEQMWFPRATAWDAVAAATGAQTVHFSDLPPGDWPCPDLSHLDWDQAADFTAALVKELWRRGILDRFRAPGAGSMGIMDTARYRDLGMSNLPTAHRGGIHTPCYIPAV